jgi:hypothetical protein
MRECFHAGLRFMPTSPLAAWLTCYNSNNKNTKHSSVSYSGFVKLPKPQQLGFACNSGAMANCHKVHGNIFIGIPALPNLQKSFSGLGTMAPRVVFGSAVYRTGQAPTACLYFTCPGCISFATSLPVTRVLCVYLALRLSFHNRLNLDLASVCPWSAARRLPLRCLFEVLLDSLPFLVQQAQVE